MRTFLFLFFLVGPAIIPAQSDTLYAPQFRAIENLLANGKFRVARTQVQGLVEDVTAARLPGPEAEARYLQGRILTADPRSSPQAKVAGIEQLRRAARGFRSLGREEELERVLETLEALTGERDVGTDASVPRSVIPRAQLPSDDQLDEAALVAIVSEQERAIMALSDSQVRQELLLERQERRLNDYAFQILNDSVRLIRQSADLSVQRMETERQRNRSNLYLALASIFILLLGSVYYRFRVGKKRRRQLEIYNAEITAERQRSEELLLNILPVTIAAELKEEGRARARRYESVTVLFADFKGFSALAKGSDPERLVTLLDEAFRVFDDIVRRHGLEKIKTIGDAYMCAAGLPIELPDHAERAVRAGLDMQAYLATNEYFSARIGIHSGPVVAGVVGRDKFAYDIWGDTVNQAARLETAGEPGRVAISRATADLLGEGFVCEPAGSFEAKNIGWIERLWVVGRG